MGRLFFEIASGLECRLARTVSAPCDRQEALSNEWAVIIGGNSR